MKKSRLEGVVRRGRFFECDCVGGISGICLRLAL